MKPHFSKTVSSLFLIAALAIAAGCATQGKPPPVISLDEPVAVAAKVGQQMAQQKAAQERKAPAPKVRGGTATGAPAKKGPMTDEDLAAYFR